MVKITEMTVEEYQKIYGKDKKVGENNEQPKVEQSKVEQPKPVVKETRKYVKEITKLKKIRKSYERFDRKEESILKKNRTLSPEELHKLIPEKNVKTIKNKLYTLFGTSIPKKARLKKVSPRNIERMTFIGTESARLIKENPGILRKEACRLANETWYQTHTKLK